MMDCSICTLPSRIRFQTAGTSFTDHQSSGEDQNQGDEYIGPARQSQRKTIRNTNQQLHPSNYPHRSVLQTVRYQLYTAKHNNGDVLDREILKDAREYLIYNSAHEFPPSLASFSGMGSFPFHLYNSIGYDRLHVLDLGILRLIPDMINTITRGKLYHPPLSI